jgi:hypothetical protein
MERSVSVLVASKDRPQCLARLLSALLLQTHPAFEVLVGLNTSHSWDDNCKQAQSVLAHRDVKCAAFDAIGRTFAEIHELLLRNSVNDLVLRLDDDHVPTPSLLRCLLEAVESSSVIAAAAPIVLHPEQDVITFDPAGFYHALVQARSKGILNTGLQLAHHPTTRPLPVPDLYSSFLMKEPAVVSVGGIALCYQICGYREETDLTIRLTLAGFAVVIAPAAVLWHLRASTGGERRAPDEWEVCADTNERIFRDRLRSWDVQIPKSFYHIWDAAISTASHAD